MVFSGGKATLCKKCKATQEKKEAERKKAQEKKKAERKAAVEKMKRELQAKEEEKRRQEEEIQRRQELKQKQREEREQERAALFREEEKEAKKHNRGCLMTIGGLLFIVLACAMHGGTPAVIVGTIGLVLFFIGFFPAINNRSASKIAEDKAMASAIVSNWGAKVQAGQSITGKDIDKARSAMGLDRAEKLEERKKVIAGAVAGGIVAGDVGAVAGAVATKAKIEEEKLNK